MGRIWNWIDLGIREMPPGSIASGSDQVRPGAFPSPTGKGAPRQTQGRPRIAKGKTLLLYAAVVLGVLGKQTMDLWKSGPGPQPSIRMMAIAMIVGAVIFQRVFRERLQGHHPPGIQYFIAFEGGFFWQSLLEGIAKLYS